MLRCRPGLRLLPGRLMPEQRSCMNDFALSRCVLAPFRDIDEKHWLLVVR